MTSEKRQVLTNPYPDLPKAGSTEEEAIEKAFRRVKEQGNEEEAAEATLPSKEATSSEGDAVGDSSVKVEGEHGVPVCVVLTVCRL